MRFLLQLYLPDTRNRALPASYQYELSAWIYHTIHFANPDFSRWLHDMGYSSGTQRYKFFTFSNLIIPYGGYRVEADRLILLSDQCSMQISFLIEEAAVPFIIGLFQNQVFMLGDTQSRVQFRVQAVERLAEPAFSDVMECKTLSPILVSKSRFDQGGTGTAYLAPDHKDYEQLFFQNLARKVSIATGEDVTANTTPGLCRLEIKGVAKRKAIVIKAHTPGQSKLIGYQYRFQIQAPAEWIRVGYFAGFGEKNSEGMGCVEVVR